jgi:hypothetical protein
MCATHFDTAQILAVLSSLIAGIELVDLIIPLGITTLSLVAITVFLGLFMRKSYRLMRKLHLIFAFAALACGVFHASLVLFLT